MIEWIIRRSVANRFLVMMAALFLSIWGTWTIIHTPVDALPDLSDVQVIVKTRYPGQAPQIVENQVTWPLTTTMLSVPGAKTVRGFSQFGDSYVYVIFEDGTDPYWARSRVLEYLNRYRANFPPGSAPKWARTPPASAGSSSTRWSTAAASTTSPNCAPYRTGS
ncbi:hypothetical protein KPZU09_43560 [Klebsiella pneumoniae]|uniref:Cobalt-zinc-cadmium resistance protein CzcA n=1 Tax=Klebsiella pneumoniae TaxID=573 RepID=A0A919HUU0_KLEPN|nr:hypothetical protein KPZU09_43560 [Klebsiella pneumoniae]